MSGRLLPDWGWACILQARECDWAARRATSFIVGGVEIEIRAGGAWRCAAGLSAETAALLELFLPLVAQAGPLVIAQLGQSLDGRIATESGASHYINAVEARTHLHRLRALVDAVVVGVGTVNADDPQLTVRHVRGSHFLCPHSPALLRRGGPEGRRRRSWRALLCSTHLPPRAGRLFRHCRGRGRTHSDGFFQGPAITERDTPTENPGHVAVPGL